MSDRNPAIELKNVHKYFGKKPVLKSINLAVCPGECYGLLGINGAGKTTLLRMLAGFVKASQGQITVLGQQQDNPPRAELKKRIGLVFDDEDLLVPEFTVREHISFIGHLYRIPAKERDHRFHSLARILFDDPEGPWEQPIRTLSRGMRKKIQLISALLYKPELLLLDEPFNSLDIITNNALLSLLGRLKGKTTIILADHHIQYVENLADRIGVLDQGTLAFDGQPDNVKQLGKNENLEESLLTIFSTAYREKQEDEQTSWLYEK